MQRQELRYDRTGGLPCIYSVQLISRQLCQNSASFPDGLVFYSRIEESNCPKGHHIESKVKKRAEMTGKNSRKSAPSTGRLPPIPTHRDAISPHVAIQLGAAPTAIPKTLPRNSVALKAIRRPIISEATPQQNAPTHNPTKPAQVV